MRDEQRLMRTDLSLTTSEVITERGAVGFRTMDGSSPTGRAAQVAAASEPVLGARPCGRSPG
ncbi:hypothetical protein [Streptomyces sp. NPDC094049]|uniref:hypothetical protein n=1 Tax=Streptomyces sp. NPDC094049 TaxID=3154987 RepID=UPI0033276F2C